MKLKSFNELYSLEYNISNIFALNQYWDIRPIFTMHLPRPTNAILYFADCSAKYQDDHTGVVINVPKGSVFYIPAGSKYSWTFYNTKPNKISTLLFEFLLTDQNGEALEIEGVGILENSCSELYKDLFDSVISEFSKPVILSARIKSAAYNLLASLSGEGRIKHLENEKLESIYAGINYLESDPKQLKTVKEIAEMCNMSVGYFERLFKEYAGCTPNAYRLQKKMERAKLLLTNECLNVEQVSLELGFEDTAYFCRIFKKMCNCTPTQYRQKTRP